MRKLMFLLTAGALALAATPAQAGYHGTTVKLRAVLDARQAVPPPYLKAPNGRGLFTATLTGTTLTWRLTYSGLSGPAIGAHIHLGKPGVSQYFPVVDLCGFLGNRACTSGMRGTAVVRGGQFYPVTLEAIMKAIPGGGAYVNIHTDRNEVGEIRGQIEVVK